jgi:uncharacterized protein with NRDE domain
MIGSGSSTDPESLFHLLADPSVPPDENLPDTGVGLEWERRLGAIFISSPTYGTRCSSLLFITRDDRVRFIERTFEASAGNLTQPVTRNFHFALTLQKP